jgi:integrase
MRGRGECTVRQRARANGGSYWEARASIHGRQVSFYAATKTAALAKARQARADAERGSFLSLPTVTVAAYLTAWLDTLRPTARQSTYGTYERVARRHIVPAIGDIRLAQLTPSHVTRLLGQMLADGYSETTARHTRTILGQALEAAVRDTGLPRNVARLARVPKADTPPFEPERLTVADVRAVLDAVAGTRVEPHVLFSIATGVRQGELMALRYEDLTEDTVTIRHGVERGTGTPRLVRPKTVAALRVLRLSEMATRALALERAYQAAERELAGAQWHDEGMVFANRTGGVICTTTITDRLRRAVAAAGLPPIRWHALRRCFAALLLDQGVPLHRIRDLLGHSAVQVTEQYAYTIPDEADMGAVDRALGYD